ncbi:aldehyde dehydrogenase family protein [Nocardia gipuzkoensis]
MPIDSIAAVARAAADNFSWETVLVEDPGPGEVLVRLVATGVCHTDLSVLAGRLPTPLPAVLGHEGAGVVEAVGAGVTTAAVGDRVVLSFASCGACARCRTGRPTQCPTYFWRGRLVGGDGRTAVRCERDRGRGPGQIRGAMTLPHARNLIDGQWRDGHAIGTSLDPATGRPLGTFADAGAVTARAAIDAARRVFDTTTWSQDRHARATALFALAEAMTVRRDELVELLSRENGKKLADAAMEVDGSIPKLRYNAALALTDSGRAAQPAPGMYSMALPQPIGVAAVIVPWNSPIILAVRSFAPALAAGCTVAMKMPAQTALTNGLLYELIAEAMPAGVVNAFTESGNTGAPVLVSDPNSDVISYTGSTVVGRAIMAFAAPGLKPVSLELGGKSPMIVFDDADLDAVVPTLTAAITTFSGQFCMAGSRILVQRGIADELAQRPPSDRGVPRDQAHCPPGQLRTIQARINAQSRSRRGDRRRGTGRAGHRAYARAPRP